MIRPTKYEQLELSLINVASIILIELKANGNLLYEELLKKVINKLGENARFSFNYSLLMLYAIGCIDYNQKLDVVVFLK